MVAPAQTSFNAGELSPLLKGRPTLDKYRNGCEVLENFIPQIQGPARKRPGTRFVAEVKDSADATRLLPFEYSTTQAYVLEFGDLYVRFYLDGVWWSRARGPTMWWSVPTPPRRSALWSTLNRLM